MNQKSGVRFSFLLLYSTSRQRYIADMQSNSPIRYDPSSHTYFSCTLRSGTSAVAFSGLLQSHKPTDLALSCLGSIGPDDMANEIVVALEDVPSNSASNSQDVKDAKAWLESREEIIGEIRVMEFKQRRKR